MMIAIIMMMRMMVSLIERFQKQNLLSQFDGDDYDDDHNDDDDGDYDHKR